jgi:phosphopantothenoylcysteine synthetase/decarboxylase
LIIINIIYKSMQESDQRTRKPRVLVGVTGSVATIRVIEIIKELLKHCEVKLVMTESVPLW